MSFGPLVKLAIMALISLCVALAEPVLGFVMFFVMLWISEILPVGVTGLLIPVAATLLGFLPSEKAFQSFGNDIIFLFIGVFFLSKAFAESGLALRFAEQILNLVPKSSTAVTFFILSKTFFLSMFMSNTASVALMLPICLGITEKLRSENLKIRLVLGLSLAATFGGISTPIGTPPNALALAFLESRGIQVNFLNWFVVGFPFALIMFLVSLLVLHLCFPAGTEKLNIDLNKKSCSLSPREKVVIFSFILALVLWILPSVSNLKISLGSAAIIAATLLFVFGALNWDKAKQVDWGTILLFGGGLSLGAVIENSEISKALQINTGIKILNDFLVAALSISLSEVSSNTASAATLIPLFCQTNANLAFLVAFSTSFGFMLPISTPANALVYGTGLISIKNMLKVGLLVDFLGAILVTLYVSTSL